MQSYFFRVQGRTYLINASSLERAEARLAALLLSGRVDRRKGHLDVRSRGAEHAERKLRDRRREDKARTVAPSRGGASIRFDEVMALA